MTRLLDAGACPDCRAELDPELVCPRCGLRLRGPRAAQLWDVLITADRLVRELRDAPGIPDDGRTRSRGPASRVPVADPSSAGPPPAGRLREPASVLAPPPPAPGPATFPGGPAGPAGPAEPAGQPASAGPAVPPRPSGPAASAAPRRPLLSAASVPVVLLSLGGLCLVAFAAVFLAVTWDVIGLTGRTLVMIAVTALVAGAAVVVTRQGLRASAETLWVVAGLVLALDVYAASAADLVTADLSGRATSTVVGLALLALGVGVATWSRRTRSGELAGVQLVAALGLGVLAVAQGLSRPEPALAAAVLVGVLLALAAGLQRLRLRWLAGGAAGLAALHWTVLLVIGTERAFVVTGGASLVWWWPLVVCSAYGALAAVLPRLGDLRSVAAGAALLPLVGLLNAEAIGTGPTGDLLLAGLTLLLLATVLVFAPLVWARGAAPLLVLGALALALATATVPLGSISLAVARGTAAAGRALPVTTSAHPLAWLVVTGVLALVVLALVGLKGPGLVGAIRGTGTSPQSPRELALVGSSVTSVVALGALVALFATGPLLWVAVLGSLVAVTAAGWSAWWVRQQPVAAAVSAVTAGYVALLASWAALASGSSLLIAMVLTALALPLAAAGVARDRSEDGVSAPVLLLGAVVAGGGALEAWSRWLGLGDDVRAVTLAVVAAGLLLGTRPALSLPTSRATVEISAVLLGLVAASSASSDDALTAVLLLLAVAPAVVAVWQDRAALAWLAALVSVALLGYRLLADLALPEVATLVVALILAIGGALRLRRDRELPSVRALGLGLALGVGPSLLLSLGDPVSLRAALVGVLALALVVSGVTLRLSAPFVVGSVALTLLVLRQLGPVVDAVERWMLLGLAGAALLVAGITWEAGLRNLSRARRYVTSLR